MSLLGDLGTAIKNKLGGTSVDNTVPRYDGTTCTLQGSGVTISDTNVVTASGGFVGNASTATKLQTARTINGVSFDGTANITVSDATAVKLSGDQTIAGVKTFSSSPIVPTPTTGTQAVNKDYVDNGAGASFVANDTRVKTALNASGGAPIYACRAWVNFNGTGTVAIRASGNVSSITDNTTGHYTVNFTTAMTDVNYSVVGGTGFGGYAQTPEFGTTKATNSCSVVTPQLVNIAGDNRTHSDNANISVSIFR